MPRIDPERLLKTLAPLLEPASGAIKSHNEVDKIYGLMSKFSKKLVSKCTYINILKSTHPEILDLFLQRGGWDMVLGWTSDANSKKNYDLLKEICGLLLCAPATIQRLKENELPKVVKSISKDCDNEEIRDLAKQVVMKWIAVAKHQDFSSTIVGRNSSSVTAPNPVPVQSCSISSTKPTVQGDPEHSAGDLDISAFDITQADLNAMIEFNPDDFSKAVDQHLDLSEAVASGNTIVHSIDNANVLIDDSTNTIKIDLNNAPEDHNTPKLLINTMAGQNVVVRVDNTAVPTKQEEPPYCIMMKDGKPFLVRLKLAPPKDVTELRNHQEITSTSSGDLLPQKKNLKNDSVDDKQLVKTYSKRTPVEVIAAIAQPPEVVTKSKSGSRSKSDTSDKKHRSSSKGSSAAAAAAAKKAAEEEKLKDKIKQEKATLKKRAKEAAKQKQQEKDQETLKKLNLNMEPSVTTPPNKIPKIPKRQSSFADAIGIPGTSDSDKIIKKKSSIDYSPEGNNDSSSSSKTSKLNLSFNDNKDKGKERRHKPKVFSSRSSRADDLLKDMTENVKSSKSNKSESSKSTGSMGEKSFIGNSTVFKPEKRPSIEGIEKPGDSKKAKIGDGNLDRKKDSSKQQTKDKKTVSVHAVKESSLFMDALTASSETTNKSAAIKRKRRLSSATDKDSLDKFGKNNVHPPVSSDSNKDKTSPPQNNSHLPQEVVKPIFNFYRETLDDSEEPVVKESLNSPNTSMEDPVLMDIGQNANVSPHEDDDEDITCIPFEADLTPLKSSLVLHRSKNKPKKCVRWREDDELTEIEYFELDEDERVNVTKHKDFLSMKEHEKAEEKEYIVKSLKQRMLNDETVEEKMPWTKPAKLYLTEQPPAIDSKEMDIQEERERLNLGMFLPPGFLLPDSAAEPDLTSPSEEERVESNSRIIPMEDVMNVTKVYDNRNLIWPRPKIDHPLFANRVVKPVLSPSNQPPFGMSSNFGDIGLHHPPPVQIQHGLPHGFPPNTQNQMNFGNPWNMGMNNSNANATPLGVPNNVNEMVRFPPPGFPPPPSIPNPFGFPLPGQNLPGIPPRFSPPLNFANLPINGQLHANNNIGMGRDAITSNNRGITNNTTRGPSRLHDYADRDLRRPLNRDPSRDEDARQRDGYDSRGRSRNDYRVRDHDREKEHRDRRSPSPRRRREDRERQDKDYRDHDYRSRPRPGRKIDVPCRYFSKGHCMNGSRCEFSHELSQPERPAQKIDARSNNVRHSPNESESWEDDNNLFERRDSSDTPMDIADTPSSPTNDMMPDPSIIPAKIIPVE